VDTGATVAATGATSEFGLVFPLRFPATVTWHGAGLKVVDGGSLAGGHPAGASGTASTAVTTALSAARRDGHTLAVLDTSTGTLAAVRPGTLRLAVTSGGLTAEREITLGS
jgi:acetyl-CoA acetyltransferase